jgi:hypothetical protein
MWQGFFRCLSCVDDLSCLVDDCVVM